jgi:hypothetical protein
MKKIILSIALLVSNIFASEQELEIEKRLVGNYFTLNYKLHLLNARYLASAKRPEHDKYFKEKSENILKEQREITKIISDSSFIEINLLEEDLYLKIKKLVESSNFPLRANLVCEIERSRIFKRLAEEVKS